MAFPKSRLGRPQYGKGEGEGRETRCGGRPRQRPQSMALLRPTLPASTHGGGPQTTAGRSQALAPHRTTTGGHGLVLMLSQAFRGPTRATGPRATASWRDAEKQPSRALLLQPRVMRRAPSQRGGDTSSSPWVLGALHTTHPRLGGGCQRRWCCPGWIYTREPWGSVCG